MKIKTIKIKLRKKIAAWLATIEDETVRNLAKESVIVTGGSIASMLREGEEVNDYDLYFTDRAAVVALTRYYAVPHGVEILYGENKAQYKDDSMDKFNLLEWDSNKNAFTMTVENLEDDQVAMFFAGSAGKLAEQKKDLEGGLIPRESYSPLFFSPHAITLTDQVQIIIRFHGEPSKIHENFDFVHATSYYHYDTNELHTPVEALRAIITDELKYVGSKYPLTSIIRIKKFLARGYTINAGEMLKIMFQLSLLNLKNPTVLSNQLVGVDIVYFDILINDLIKAQQEPGFEIDIEWMTKKIDLIFNEMEHDDD